MPTSEDGGKTVTVQTLEMGRDEADRKLRGEGWDPLTVENKDPAFHYRWLNKNKINMARKVDYLGYEIVSGGKEETILHEGTRVKKGADLAGPIEVGDMVLARIPREKHLAYRKANQDRIVHRTRALASEGRSAIDRAAGGRVSYEEHFDNRKMREDN